MPATSEGIKGKKCWILLLLIVGLTSGAVPTASSFEENQLPSYLPVFPTHWSDFIPQEQTCKERRTKFPQAIGRISYHRSRLATRGEPNFPRRSVTMAGRVILMSPSHKKVLTPRQNSQDEKENNLEHRTIIVRNSAIRDSSDSDSDGSFAEKKRKSPHYVTREDGLPQRRRLPAADACTPTALPPHVIARRNERERNRVRQVNESFAVLRSHIPEYLLDTEALEAGSKSNRKKLSKVDTLRLAVHYIQKLENLLDLKSDTSSDDDRVQFFESESQMSSQKTDSELDSDIMDLSSDPRRGSPPSEADSLDKIKFELKFEEDFQCQSEGESPDRDEGSPYHSTSYGLPPISTFPTNGLRYADLYPQ